MNTDSYFSSTSINSREPEETSNVLFALLDAGLESQPEPRENLLRMAYIADKLNHYGNARLSPELLECIGLPHLPWLCSLPHLLSQNEKGVVFSKNGASAWFATRLPQEQAESLERNLLKSLKTSAAPEAARLLELLKPPAAPVQSYALLGKEAGAYTLLIIEDGPDACQIHSATDGKLISSNPPGTVPAGAVLLDESTLALLRKPSNQQSLEKGLSAGSAATLNWLASKNIQPAENALPLPQTDGKAPVSQCLQP